MTHSMQSVAKPKPSILEFEAIGTRWTIECDVAISPAVLDRIMKRIDQFDRHYSRFRIDSLVHRISQTAGTYELPEDANKLLDFYALLYKITDGAVTPLIGQTLSDAGYDADYSLEFKTKTIAPDLGTTYSYDKSEMQVYAPALLDFGAAGKGYLVDIISELLVSEGITEFTVNAGGDIRHFTKSNRQVTIALQHPEQPDQAIGTVNLQNNSICGSSVYARRWADNHHVMDPRTAESPNHLKAVWVVSQDAMVSDGLTTALFFTEPEILREHFDFEYLIVNQDYSVHYSKNFPGEVFVSEPNT